MVKRLCHLTMTQTLTAVEDVVVRLDGVRLIEHRFLIIQVVTYTMKITKISYSVFTVGNITTPLVAQADLAAQAELVEPVA